MKALKLDFKTSGGFKSTPNWFEYNIYKNYIHIIGYPTDEEEIIAIQI